jgi:twitching motility two-component system response regulator PilH
VARVLVVDDSATEMQRMVGCLSRHGHQVLTARNGADGVEMAQRAQPDVVLMDVVMPGVNGFKATRDIKRGDSTRHIPVIIVSSKSEPSDEAWGRRQGASGYIHKPFDERRLINELNRVLLPEAPPA